MLSDSFKYQLNDWSRKSQMVWDLRIPHLINQLESWHYKTKKIKINLETINPEWYKFEIDTLYDFILHCKITDRCNFKHPVIVNHRGYIIDGRHRVVKAILKWHKYIDGIMILEDITASTHKD